MKSPLRLLAALSTLLLGSAVFAAAQEAPANASAPKEEKPETELTKQMDKMNAAFRKLRRQATDATKNADSLAQVAILKEFATASAKLEPAKAATIPAADRAKWVANYRAKMTETLANIDKLEAALKAGQNEEAGKLVTELNNQQRAGHKEYRAEEKK
jgi:soluble cytochrome b562